MLTPQFILPLHAELVVDLFAGGGGASTGIEQAIGRAVDIAINHDPEAISLHQANHPQTMHYCSDVFEVDPVAVTHGRPVGLLWASPDCFPAGTLVMTREGYTPIEEIHVGDEVLTHKARWRKVTETSSATRPLISIKGHGHPGIAVSPEHPFLARLRKDVWQNSPRGYKRTLEPQDWVPASALDKGWYWSTLTDYPSAEIPPIEGRGMAIDDKLLWLVGRYIGDGWTRLTDKRAEVVITCGKHEVERLRSLLDQWPRASGRADFNELAWHELHTGTAYQFTTNHRGLVEWLRKHFGHRAESKRVPAWALGIAPDFRRALLDGYLSADGWDNDTFSECRTVSKALAFGIKALLSSLGKTVTAHRLTNTSVIEGREIHAREIYMLRWRAELSEKHAQTFREDGMEWCPIREQEDLGTTAEVFNIGVADDESYLVEGIVVHNCKHFSKAKGGKPVSKKIRSLAWVVVKWAKAVRPRIICLENVEEFKTWGPLDANQKPCPERKGETFQIWVGCLRRFGYKVEWKELRACDYGAPTIRKRLFLVARRDGLPIQWPVPTHGDPKHPETKARGLKPWRTAAECIDWSLPTPSIFDRARPLADATLRRIARGIVRYVINAQEPFIVSLAHGDGVAMTNAFMTKFNTGSTGFAVDSPMHTIIAGGEQARPGTAITQGLVTAFLAKHYGGVIGTGLSKPISTVTSVDHHSLVSVFLTEHANASNQRNMEVTEPLRTQCAQVKGGHFAAVAALLVKYYGNERDGVSLLEPMHTIPTKDRFGLVTVQIGGEAYVITDIGMRMLQPHELYAAQGFPTSYCIDKGADGKPLTKAAQVRMCGNSVCPPMARLLVEANYTTHERKAAA